MNELRRKRLESSIVRELSGQIVRRRIKDVRLGFVSIVGVELAPDLSRATIRVSLFADEAENQLTWKALRDHLNWFQSEVSRNLRLRVTPRFELQRDTTIAEGDHIIDLLEQGEHA